MRREAAEDRHVARFQHQVHRLRLVHGLGRQLVVLAVRPASAAPRMVAGIDDGAAVVASAWSKGTSTVRKLRGKPCQAIQSWCRP